MKIYVGTSGFAYKEWKGTFYPSTLAPEAMLRSYARRLGTVEINNTFYHMPTQRILEGWAAQVPKSFRFAFKAPQVITHFKRLRHVDEEIGYLFKTLSLLGPKLGPVLFQFPASFALDVPALAGLLTMIPGKSACAFEFRHPSWLADGVLDLLRTKGCSLCIADTDEHPATEIDATASWGYLRLRRSDYTDRELSRWAKRILSQKWKKAFVFIKHEDGAKGPQLAQRLGELAGALTQPTP
jgi:uncharacterized protein YecE (DUF72 family)